MGFLACSLLVRFPSLLIDSGLRPRFGKERDKSFHGTWAKNGRTESNVCRKAKTWIPSPFVPNRLSFFSTTSTDPDHPPQNFAALQRIIDSLAWHAGHIQRDVAYYTGVQVFFICDSAPAASCSFIFTWVE